MGRTAQLLFITILIKIKTLVNRTYEKEKHLTHTRHTITESNKFTFHKYLQRTRHNRDYWSEAQHYLHNTIDYKINTECRDIFVLFVYALCKSLFNTHRSIIISRKQGLALSIKLG